MSHFYLKVYVPVQRDELMLLKCHYYFFGMLTNDPVILLEAVEKEKSPDTRLFSIFEMFKVPFFPVTSTDAVLNQARFEKLSIV